MTQTHEVEDGAEGRPRWRTPMSEIQLLERLKEKQ